MKIYLAVKFHLDQRNRAFVESVLARLSGLGHQVVCAVRDFENWGEKQLESRELLRKAFAAIDQSDLVLIEATEKGMGVGIEAGYAFARKIPVVTVAKTGSDLSTNLASLSERVQLYDEVEDIRV